MIEYPTQYLLSSGSGEAPFALVAFDQALISAGLANYNLLKVSSILPAECMEVERLELPDGEGSALLVAYGSISSDTPGDLIASAVAVGIPKEINRVGVIMEVSGHFDAKKADEQARKMVELAMKNHGIPLKEIKSSYTEKRVEGGKHACVISALAMW